MNIHSLALILMSSTHTNKHITAIEDRFAERALFFWTVREGLRLLLFAAVVVYIVLSLAGGLVPRVEVITQLVRELRGAD